MSQVHLTSAAVNGLPSCHLAPGHSLKVSRCYPRPTTSFGQFRLDELRAILPLVLFKQQQVVKDPHHRRHRRDRRLFVDRHARGAVTMEKFEDSAGLLSGGRPHGKSKVDGNRERQCPKSAYHAW